MSESITTDDRLSQQIEEIKRDITESTVQTMVGQALDILAAKYEERDREREKRSQDFIAEMRRQMAEEYRQMRSDAQSATVGYATIEDVAAKAQEYARAEFEPLKVGWQDLQQDFNRESERREKIFQQRIEQILTLAEEGKNRSVENEKEIARMKGENAQRFGQIEKNIDALRRDIDTDVKTVADAAKRMDGTFAKFVEKSEKRIDRIEQNASTVARDVVSAGKKIEDLEELRIEDFKEIRRIDTRISNELNIVQDIDGRVRVSMERMENALYGNAKEKEPGLVADMKTLKNGIAWQVWMSNHPRISLTMFLLFVLAITILSALIQGRPELVAQMIPLPSGNPTKP